jgi:RHS repeat-associated protein
MKAGLLALVASMACCATGLMVSPVTALGEGSPTVEGTGASSPSLGSPLVTPGSPIEGQQAQAAEEAKLANPESVAAREASQTKYEGLSGEAAQKLAGEAFPAVIDEQAGGPPKLPAGQQITSYLNDNAARVSLPEGKHGVIEASEPMAIETSPGQLLPIDLGLSESSGSFGVARAAVPLGIPKQLQDGVSIVGSGVSLTPVNASGAAVGGSEGSIDGATAFYGGVELGSDVDVVVKPTTTGFAEDALLRSVRSPQQLSFRLGLPEGATVRQAHGASGPVEVVKEGQVLAAVMPPSAEDAAGTAVPVTMSVSGDTLTLSVDEHAGEYEYPIDVDPTVVDEEWAHSDELWGFYNAAGTAIEQHALNQGLNEEISENRSIKAGEWAYFYYETPGKSQIYSAHGKLYESGEIQSLSRGEFYIGSPANEEEALYVLPSPELHESPLEVTLCVESGCKVPAVEASREGNWVDYKASVLTSSERHSPISYSFIENDISIVQEAPPTVSMDTADETIESSPNPLYGGGRWVNATKAKMGLEAEDPGLGVQLARWSSSTEPKWEPTYAHPWPIEALLYERIVSCKGGKNGGLGSRCPEKVGSWWGENAGSTIGLTGLPEGEDKVEAKVWDPVGLTAATAVTVKIDNAPPHNVTLSELPSTHEISDGQHFPLKATAESGPAGIASIRLTMDGQEVGTPSKGCTGSCMAHGEWTLSGESYAAGEYTLDVIATDNAGNVTTEVFHVTIHHASDVSVGPGAVSPTTGELALGATDVSISVPDGGLTVGRSYRSRHMGVEAESPLGPQWGLSVGASESLSRTASGSMVLTGSNGQQSVFAGNGKGEGKGVYTSPPGDAGLTLTEKVVGKATDFLLSENGAVTTFAVPSGGSGAVWEPSISEGADGTNAATFAYQTVEVAGTKITEPTEELAPVPSGVSCSPTLNKGCRALKFVYATGTTATGEAPNQWGEYKGRLLEVTFTAYESSSKEMKTKAVAKYVYDSKGRLRTESNPQITPELKTVYGYDGEGHVTALAPAGQQPWLFEQGTTASDTAPGRVLAVARPAATTEAVLKTEMEEPAPVIKTAPTLSSTTPTVGVKISVNLTSEKTPGTWSNSPLAFSYQWEDCSKEGKECTAIPGAVNQNYYPVASDEGHELAAEVVALNADGSGTASSAATGVVAKGTPNTPLPEPPAVGSLSVWTLDYQVPLSGSEPGLRRMTATQVARWGQTDVPAEGQAMAVFPPDQPMGWPAKEYTRASVYYLDGRDRSVNVSSPTGGVSTAEYNLYNDVVRTLSPDNRATVLAAPEEKSVELSKELDTESTYEEKGSEPGTKLLSTLGPKHTVELTNGAKAEAREHTVYSYNEGAPTEGGPYHLVTKMTQGAQVAGTEESASVRTTKTTFSGQNNLGWKLRQPSTVTVEPSGLSLTHSTFYEPTNGNVTETRMPAAGAPGEEQGYYFHLQFGKAGTEKEQFKEPSGIAVNASGDAYVLDTGNSRIQEFGPEGKWIRTFGALGTVNGDLKLPRGIAVDSSGNVWVADTGNNRIEEFSPTGTYTAQFGTTETFKEPQGVAVSVKSGISYIWIADTGNNRVREYEEEGGVFYSYRKFGTEGTGEEQFKGPQGITLGAEGNVYVADTGNNRIDEYSSVAKHIRNFGKEGTGNGLLKTPHGITTDSAGNVWIADAGNNRVQEFSATGTFLGTFGKEGTTEGKLKGPQGVAITAEGDAWVADTANSNVQEWLPYGSSGYGSGTASAHNDQTIYYTAGVNSKVTACGEHPEWANLPCQTQPAAQPGGSLPALQVTTYTYNIWDEPETTTSTSGTTTRKTTDTYDAAGRLKTTVTSSTVGTTLPTITYKYSETLGALEEQSNEGKTKPIVSHYNTLGQLTSYTDATESTTTYEYDIDGRPKTINDGKGAETYTYSTTTGLPTELLNEYGTTKLVFTGTYDVEGNLLTEGYPNGMTATYTYNQVGKPTALVYKKATHCTEEEKEICKWFTDTVAPSIHGQWLEQTSTLSRQAYTYDGAGRLTQVQNTPAAGKCTTRIYAYDKDTNRTSLTTYGPGSEGKCATETGTEEKHTYDTADRLNDEGVSYNSFGDATALPAADAGGKETSEGLTSEYYVDNQLASEKQGEQTIGYQLDPSGRTIETAASGKRNETVINHYAGPGATPAWTSNLSGETTREIPGINGTLTATQGDLAEPVLQLTNLHGDIVATASLSETATALTGKVDTSEFGVPTTSLPPKYSWLGALDIPTELPSGVLDMGARSYVPQLGRFLQPDPISGGSANAYSYTFGDPVNTSDPSGATPSFANIAGAIQMTNAAVVQRMAEEAATRRASEEAAARMAAEFAAAEAAYRAEWAAGPQYAGEEEEEWWGEEEEVWAEEQVAFHSGEGKQATPLVEEGLFFQSEAAIEGGSRGVVMCVEHSKAAGHPCTMPASALAHMCLVEHDESACTRYVSFFGNLVHGAENLAKGAVKAVVKAARGIVHWLKSHAAEVQTVGCLVQGIGVGTLVGAGATALSDGIGVYSAGIIGGTAGAAVTYACEREKF